MKYRLATTSEETQIELSDTLSFHDHQEFRALVGKVMATKPRQVTVDLSNLTMVDSAGLGLLVILNGQLKHHGGTLMLRRPVEAVSRLLSIVQFDKLCTIEP
jgi:HptB-dependent secretion and biofilm anti anti-sigma factor